MPEDQDNIFSSSAMLLTGAETLPEIRAKLAPVTDGGMAITIIRDPEYRSKLDLRMLPGVPSAPDEIIRQNLDQLERSTLVSATTAQRLLKMISTLRGMAQPQRDRYQSSGISAEIDLKGTLAGGVFEGDVFAIVNISGSEGSLAEALLTIKGDVWLSPVSCTVNYRSGPHRFRDWWALGKIEHGSAGNAKARLDEMADRRKISSDRAACIADWIELLAERTAALPTIKITQK